jgi:predicted component of type VI protein secretion system
MTKKINVEDLQLRVWQLDGELETIRDRIRQYGLEEFFETKSEAEDNDELADKIVAVLDALRTCLLQFKTRLSQLQKEAEAGLS